MNNTTVTKTIWEPKRYSSPMHQKLCIHAQHHPSGISGIVFLPVLETPVEILNNIEDGNWDHPLLEEMQREAFARMRAKAEQAFREVAA